MAACSTTPVVISSCTLDHRIIGNRLALLSSSISIRSTLLWLFSAGAQRLSATPQRRILPKANTLEDYPAELSLTTLICFMGAHLSSAVTFITEGRNAKPWSIGWDMRFVTAFYSGVMCSGLAYYVQGIVMEEKGPVFVTAFNPLCMITTALLGFIILAEHITLGQIIGVVIIVSGLYSFIWGKSKDYMVRPKEENENNSALELPNDQAQ